MFGVFFSFQFFRRSDIVSSPSKTWLNGLKKITWVRKLEEADGVTAVFRLLSDIIRHFNENYENPFPEGTAKTIDTSLWTHQ